MSEHGPFETRYAPNGMVCSVDHLASSAGVAMLRAGGSAADAAVAASAVLAVTSPHLCGMGGDLFALVHDRAGAPAVLNASGRAGSGADPGRLRGEGLSRPPFRLDVRAVPVPGCVDGWVALHHRFGRLPLADVLEPARRLALDGFTVSTLLSAALVLVEGRPHTDDFFTPARLRPGERCRRPGTAAALGAIAARGRDGFYGGAFGEGLLALGGAEYQPDDLDRPSADWVDPLGLRVWDHDLWTVPPNSQGYLTLAAAGIAEGLGLPADPDDDAWPHLLAEAAKQAGYDRDLVLSERADGPSLVDDTRLAQRRAAIDPDQAGALLGPGAAGDTMYLCAVDADGMGVSLIQSNAADFGSHLVEPNTGTFLHNRGIGFTSTAGHPAEYGPGRRPPSTLAPALITTPDGHLRAVLGTMGGDAQPQIVLQLAARLLQAGQRPGTAVRAPRFVLARHGPGEGFDTWSEPRLLGVDVEADAPPAWLEGLRRRGHPLRVQPPFHGGMGHAHLIECTASGLAGMSDPRAGAGAALGW